MNTYACPQWYIPVSAKNTWCMWASMYCVVAGCVMLRVAWCKQSTVLAQERKKTPKRCSEIPWIGIPTATVVVYDLVGMRR